MRQQKRQDLSHHAALGSVLPLEAPGSWRSRGSRKAHVSLLAVVSFFSLRAKEKFIKNEICRCSNDKNVTQTENLRSFLKIRKGLGYPPRHPRPWTCGDKKVKHSERQSSRHAGVRCDQCLHLLSNKSRLSHHAGPTIWTLKTIQLSLEKQNQRLQ